MKKLFTRIALQAKASKKARGGFTLIELLLVMAIIGILAAAILVGISGQRERARKASALQTAKSVVPYLADCYMRAVSISAPTNTTTGEGAVCSGSSVVWPSFGNTGCTWPAVAIGTGTTFTVTCPGGNITCDHGLGGDCRY